MARGNGTPPHAAFRRLLWEGALAKRFSELFAADGSLCGAAVPRKFEAGDRRGHRATANRKLIMLTESLCAIIYFRVAHIRSVDRPNS